MEPARILQDFFWTTLSSKIGRIGCPETSVNNYQHMPRNIPKEERPLQKSCKARSFSFYRGIASACAELIAFCLSGGTLWLLLFLGVDNHSVKYVTKLPVFQIIHDFIVTCQTQRHAPISAILACYHAGATL